MAIRMVTIACTKLISISVSQTVFPNYTRLGVTSDLWGIVEVRYIYRPDTFPVTQKLIMHMHECMNL